MYRHRPTLKDRLSDGFLWFRYIGWMILVALIVLGGIGYGMYLLAVASPIVKLVYTLGGILLFNLITRFPVPKIHLAEKQKWYVTALGISGLILLPFTFYCLFLSTFVLPWFVSLCLILSFAITVVTIALTQKNIKIPALVAWSWIRIILYWFSVAYMAYMLAALLGWF